MKKNIHEYDDYTVGAYLSDSRDSAWVELWHGCSFVKAVWKYIQYHWNYPKYTIRFMHNRYY